MQKIRTPFSIGGMAFALSLTALAAACSTTALAETRALVVGVDKYRNGVPPLNGAANDARDISKALQGRGVKNLTTLIDLDATRASVLGALDKMVDEAQAGDLVIISFAGHGVPERWGKAHPPGVTEGEERESYLLAGAALPDSSGKVDPARGGAAAAAERIVSTEMAARLRKLEDKKVRTIFVADTCFGGGMTRGPIVGMGPIRQPTYRVAVPLAAFLEGQDPLESVYRGLPAPINTDIALPSLTFLAGVDRRNLVPEVNIPRGSSTIRGALSFAFARVIDGTAQLGPSGEITRGEMMRYINQTVRQYAENRQDPDLRPRSAQDLARVVIKVSTDFPSQAAPEAATVSKVVTVFSEEPLAPFQAPNGTFEMRPTSSRDAADYRFDPKTCTVLSAANDVVATAIRNGGLPGVAEREVALRHLLELAKSRPREIRLERGDRRYVEGETAVADARPQASNGGASEYYVLFNVTGTGLVQFLYPNPKYRDPATLPLDVPFEDIRIKPPFGADTLVLVVSPRPLDKLIADIMLLDPEKNKAPAALAAAELIRQSLALNPDMRIGLQGLFTFSKSGVASC